MKLTNAFSLNMLAELPADVRVMEITLELARGYLENGVVCARCGNTIRASRNPSPCNGVHEWIVDSAVGHADTAAVFTDVLGLPVRANRTTVSLAPGNAVIVGQYRGPRLPEGATRLPDGATIQWLLVEVHQFT